MAEIALRRWLMKQPYPELVHGELADGTVRPVRIGLSRSKWRDAEEALKGAVRAEALDKDGNVLRTWESDEQPAARPAKDLQILRDIELAKIIADVSDKAVARYEGIMEKAFAQNNRVLELVSDRLVAIESAWHERNVAEAEALAEQAEQQAQAAALAPVDELAHQVIAGEIGRAMRTNGAPPPKPKE